MKLILMAAIFVLGIVPSLSMAQEKIAEGEYQLLAPSTSTDSPGRTASRWRLWDHHPGHFRLESEIQGLRFGMRVIQIEYLDEAMVPTAIGYNFYRKDEQTPSITTMCNF